MGSWLLRGQWPGRRLLVPISVGLAALMTGVAGCGGSASAGSKAPVESGQTAAPTSSAPGSSAPGSKEATASAPPSASAGTASMQEFGEQVFSLVADNRARLKLLLVMPSATAGEKCVSVYSDRGDAIAAQTQDSDVGQIPPPGTPKAMVSACERGSTITQIATDNVVDMHHDTAVLDAQYPAALTTLGLENADGSDMRTTHNVSQQILLHDATAALEHLEDLVGLEG